MKKFTIFFLFVFFISINLIAQENRSPYQNLDLFDHNKTGLIDIESSFEMQRLYDLKSSLTTAQKKLSTDLIKLTDQRFLSSDTDLQSQLNSMMKLNQIKLFERGIDLREQVSEGIVYVYIFLYEGFDTNTLDELVGVITDRDEKNSIVVAWVKIKELESLAELDVVRTIRTVYPPVTSIGSVTTEGDAVHRTSLVRSTYGEDGTGVNVGIISDGVTTRSTAQASGDLPPDGGGLTVLSAGSGDEGTAMLEIVHDMVPGANLFFHDAGANTTAFNTAISNLVSAGCNIICDDIGWLTQPFFEDGNVASHVSSVLAANDIIYVSSCGNNGQRHYQGDFYPVAPQPLQHDFSSGGTSGYYLYINLPEGANALIIFQWDDAFGASSNDYDLYLYSFDQSTTVDASFFTQDGDGDPIEIIDYTATSSGATNDYAIIVQKYSASDAKLELFIYPSGGAGIYSNNITPVDAIFGHKAVDEVVSCAAVDQATPTTIELFSSNGPSTIAHPSSEIRQTPKITGVDGVTVTGAGGFPSPFYGTSAAAPHISAILAQTWSYDLGQTPYFVRQYLYDWAVDLGAGNYDNVYGYGRADAFDIFVGGGLPVELSSFTGKAIKNENVQLNWSTATEIDNYGFEVERKIAQTENWVNLGFVAGHGNSNSEKHYSFVDNNLTGGTEFAYRLKQIDNDGKFEYSNEIEVVINLDEYSLSQNYPNPFNPTTTIKFSLVENSNVKLEIMNILGETVSLLLNGNLEAGNHDVEFNASGLPSGIYFYSLNVDGKFTETRKTLLIR
jgi:hypothetical protein